MQRNWSGVPDAAINSTRGKYQKSFFFNMPAACIGTFAPFFPLLFTSGDGSTVRSS
jgi:hypothetical protein